MKYSKNYSVFLIILAMLVCLYSTGYADIMLDAYHFPDTTFRSFIRQQGFDKNGDGILSDTELAKVKIIEYNGHGDDVDKCKSLQGIEFFPNLEELTVASAPVEELNVQQNKKLKILNIGSLWSSGWTHISHLDLSQNQALEQLSVIMSLHSVNLSNCKALKEIEVRWSELNELNVTGCPELESILVSYAHSLTSIDISHCPKLKKFTWGHTQLYQLDISKCPYLLEVVKNGTYEYDEDEEQKYYRLDDLWLSIPGDTKLITENDQTITVSGLTYKVTSESTLAFAGLEKAGSKSTVTIPDTVTDKGVTYRVTRILSRAMYKDSKITALTIGKNVHIIEKEAFASCKKLKTVKGGAVLKDIEDGVFSGCKVLKSFPVLNKLETIGANVFKGDKALTAITLAKKVRLIGKNAFNGCASLKSINVKTGKLNDKHLGAGAFMGIHKKATFKCPQGKVKEYKKLFIQKGAPKTCIFK